MNAETPLLSASLPTGERVQVVLPPAVPAGTVAITIRRPSGRVWGLDELAQGGVFERCVAVGGVAVDGREQELNRRAIGGGEWAEFLKLAVRCTKEHRRVGGDGVREDDADQGTGAGDPAR